MVTEEMVGHKFGEFSPTRVFYGHSPIARPSARPGAARRGARSGRRAGRAAEVQRAMGKKARERDLSRQRGQGGGPHAAGEPAEAQSGRAADPRQEGRDRACGLDFSRKRIARDVRKCLESAIANAENNHDLDVDELSSPRRMSARRS
jgi:hypothetical protein